MWVLSHENPTPRARRVLPVSGGSDLVEEIQEKLDGVPNFLGAYRLAEYLTNRSVSLFLVDNVGVVFGLMHPSREFAEVHITFWDRVLEGREDLCADIAQFYMNSNGAKFVVTTIPKSRKRLLAFAKRAGFVSYDESEDKIMLALMRKGGSDGR
jgi:hypothetical protein